MKMGEEKFDDEIRQKLRHSEVTPPAGFFDQIVPPPDKRRGFLWIWFAGILLLGLTAFVVKFGAGPKNSTYSANERMKRSSVKEAPEQFAGKQINSNIESSNADISSAKNSSMEEAVNTHHSQPELNTTNSSQQYGERNRVNANHEEPSSRSTDVSMQSRKYKGDKNDTGNPKYYANRKSEGVMNTPNYDILYTPVPSLPYNEKIVLKQQIRIMKPDQTEFDPHTPSGFGVEIVVSKLQGYASVSKTTTDTMQIRLLNSLGDSDVNSSGFDIAVLGTYALNTKFKLRAGIHYAQRKQEFSFEFNEYYNQLDIDTIQYYILFPFSPPQLVTRYDSTILHLSRTHHIDHQLIFKAVSVSADICYQLPAGRFLIEPQAGIIADVYSTTGGSTNFNSRFEERDGDSHFDNSIQLRAKGGLQIGYSLSEKYNVFVHSEYQLGLSAVKTSEEFYEEKTNVLSVGAGVRYTIFKSQAAKSTP